MTSVASAEQRAKIQEKTFTRWINAKLKSAIGTEPVIDLHTDLADGVYLTHLISFLSPYSIEPVCTSPKHRLQKMENLNAFFEFMKFNNILVHNIGSEDILEGNFKLILALLWILILQFSTLQKTNDGDDESKDSSKSSSSSTKENLLAWCQEITKDYDNVDLKDFHKSWNNGLGLCALIHHFNPQLIDYSQLKAENKQQNAKKALQIGTEKFGIPQLIDVEDLISDHPDEKSITAYIIEWHNKFKNGVGQPFIKTEKEEAKRPVMDPQEAVSKIKDFVQMADEALELEKEYEERAARLIDQIDDQLSKWGNLSQFTHCHSFAETTDERRNMKIYRLTLKRDWAKEKSELNVLLGNIKTKLTTYNLHPYHPPGDLSPRFLDILWLSLTDIEKEAFRRINLAEKKIQDELCQEFSTCADSISELIHTCEQKFTSLGGAELEQQLSVLTELTEKLKPVDDLLLDLQNIDAGCKEAEIVHNDYTDLCFDDLHYEYTLLEQAIAEKLSFIETQINIRESLSKRTLTPLQIEEFESIFKKMTPKNSKFLELKPFIKTLQALDLGLDKQEIDQMFQYGKKQNTKGVQLDGFIKIMTELVGDDYINVDTLIDAFKAISGGKLFLTDHDLESTGLDEASISKIKQSFPKCDHVHQQQHQQGEAGDQDDDAAVIADTSYDFVQFVSDIAGLSLAAEGETVDSASILSHSSESTVKASMENQVIKK